MKAMLCVALLLAPCVAQQKGPLEPGMIIVEFTNVIRGKVPGKDNVTATAVIKFKAAMVLENVSIRAVRIDHRYSMNPNHGHLVTVSYKRLEEGEIVTVYSGTESQIDHGPHSKAAVTYALYITSSDGRERTWRERIVGSFWIT